MDNDRFACRRTAVYSRCSHAPSGRYGTRELHIGILDPTGWNRNIPARTELLSRWRDRPPDRAGVLQVNVGSSRQVVCRGARVDPPHQEVLVDPHSSWSIPTAGWIESANSVRCSSRRCWTGRVVIGDAEIEQVANAEAVLTGLELVPTMSQGDSPPTRGPAR